MDDSATWQTTATFENDPALFWRGEDQQLPSIPESSGMESSTHASSHTGLLAAPRTPELIPDSVFTALSAQNILPLDFNKVHASASCSAVPSDRPSLVAFPEPATPTPVTRQPRVSVYFPSKALSPRGSIIIVVLA